MADIRRNPMLEGTLCACYHASGSTWLKVAQWRMETVPGFILGHPRMERYLSTNSVSDEVAVKLSQQSYQTAETPTHWSVCVCECVSGQ